MCLWKKLQIKFQVIDHFSKSSFKLQTQWLCDGEDHEVFMDKWMQWPINFGILSLGFLELLARQLVMFLKFQLLLLLF